MSGENIEILRRAYDAFNRQDFDALLDLLDPGVEWRDIPGLPGTDGHVGGRVGREGVRETWERHFQSFDNFRIEPIEFTETNGRVIVTVRVSGNSKTTDSGVGREMVHIVRRGYEAFAQGDIDAILDISHPEVEAHDHLVPDRPSPYRGHQGMVQYIAEVVELWDDFRMEPEDFIESSDQIFVAIRTAGRGKGSGVPAEDRTFHVWTFRDGKVVRLDIYQHRTEALEAAGLQE